MSRRCRLALALLPLAGCAFAHDPMSPLEPSIVPQPAQLVLHHGSFELDRPLRLSAPRGDAQAAAIAARLAAESARLCGRTLELESRRWRGGDIRLQRSDAAGEGEEAYRIEVTPRRITLAAAADAGLRHASTSLLQLLCDTRTDEVRAMQIIDAPVFAWRGVMLDSARHYQSPEFIRRFVDAMAWHKLNVLHWHLTDDQAWRLEIRKYPKLTAIGAWRVPAGAAPRKDIDPVTGAPRRYGGFYSQATVRELVAYAAERGITIVPEIEMPGHASAAIAAYPELGALPGSVREVPSDWGIYANAFALDEATFTFLEDVLRETMELFPSSYIHVGGDEVEDGQWKQSKLGRELADRLGGAQGHALQTWFTERIARFVAASGRRMVGWDEILTPGLAPDAVVMSWRGIEGAIQAAARGHDTVLSPWPTLYFDNRQSGALDEPPGRVRTIALRDVYEFDPLPESIAPEARRHVLGLQGNVWTEHIRTEDRVAHMTFPRAAAVAEVGWTPPQRREWGDFVRRLEVVRPSYAKLGIAAADSVLAPQHHSRIDADGRHAHVALATQFETSVLSYIVDRPHDERGWQRYAGEFVLPLPATLRFDAMHQTPSPPQRQRRVELVADDALRRRGRELQLCSEHIPLMLEDDAPVRGERAVFAVDIQDPCWRWPEADLGGVQTIEVAVGQVPFNFQIGEARERIRFAAPETPEGELEIRLDRCDGELFARLPLRPALASDAVTRLTSTPIAPRSGTHDLCLRFAQPALDPIWVVDSIRLVRP
jgi:hexosaminidase